MKEAKQEEVSGWDRGAQLLIQAGWLGLVGVMWLTLLAAVVLVFG